MEQSSLFGDGDPACRKCDGSGKVWDARIGEHRMCDCRAVRLPAPDVNPVAPAGIAGRADEIRLNKQQAVVWAVMRSGAWFTGPELEERTGYNWASISARLRDLRKQKYGGHAVERESLGGGLFRYRLVPNPLATVVA